jgi:DNA-binding winged helix-turn-helix (wHTH) protein/Tol biopolymer transport system component
MPEQATKSVRRFGLFEADLQSRELRRNGHKVRLQDQPFQVLVLLLEKPGEVVTREELRTRLWPSDTFVDFDHGLNAAIKRLRDALGDSAENPRFVETLARRGYRFIAPVEAETEEPAEVSNWRRYVLAGSAAALLIAGVTVGWHAGRRSAAAVIPADRRLTGNLQNDPIWSAALSPEGKYLAFADKAGLFLRIVGTGETHVIAEGDDLKTTKVSWFPDGTRVLVTRGRWPENKPSLWAVPILGGPPGKLTDDAQQGVVSPDGRQIAFTRGEHNRQEVWIMNADGDGARKVRAAGGDYGSMIWTRDGRRLVLIRNHYELKFDNGDVSIEICDPLTGNVETILTSPLLCNALAWTPDDRLIYSLSEPPPNRSDSNLWIQKMDPKTYKPVGQAGRLTMGPDAKSQVNLSADGKRLVYLRYTYSPQIYTAEVNGDHRTFGVPRRLELGERRNLPYDWTADGKSVLFVSDRDGTYHLFKQAPDEAVPELLVGGDSNVIEARLDPEGTSVLYMLGPAPGDEAKRVRLMRRSLAGGVAQMIVAEPEINNFQCARGHSMTCIYSQTMPDRLTFYRFDPATGEKTLFLTITDPDWVLQNWTLSPDGTTLAEAKGKRSSATGAEIRLVRLDDGNGERTLRLPNWYAISCFDWAADGKSFWVSAMDAGDAAAMLNVTVSGRITPVLREAERSLGWAIPSRDGRHVALWKGEQSENAWMLENF